MKTPKAPDRESKPKPPATKRPKPVLHRFGKFIIPPDARITRWPNDLSWACNHDRDESD